MKKIFHIAFIVFFATSCINGNEPLNPEPFTGERNASGYHSRDKISTAENWPEFESALEECYSAIIMPKGNISFQTKIEAMLVASIQAQGVHFQAEAAYALHLMGVPTGRILNLFDFENHASAFTDKELRTYRFFNNAGVMPERSNAADIDSLLKYYTYEEAANLIAATSFTVMLNAYNEALATITPQEITAWCVKNLPAVNWDTGIHTGTLSEKNAKFTKPLYKIMERFEPNTTNDNPVSNVINQRNEFGYHDRDKLEFWMHFPEFADPFWVIDNMITLGTGHVSMKQMLVFSAAISTANQAVHTQAHVIRGFEILMSDKDLFSGLYDLNKNEHLYSDKELSGIRFMQASAHLPSRVTSQHIDELRKYYSNKGVANILALASIFMFLTNYNEICAVVTDEEAIKAAERNLAVAGWEKEIHAGTNQEQRKLFPAALYIRMKMDPSLTDKSYGLMAYDYEHHGTMELESLALAIIHYATWLVQIILGLILLLVGTLMLFKPKEQMVETLGPAMVAVPSKQIKLIGSVLLLCAIGIVLPWWSGTAHIISPLIAVGLSAAMLVPIFILFNKKEYKYLIANIILMLMTLMVAIVRFGFV